MIHRLLITGISVLTIAACQNKMTQEESAIVPETAAAVKPAPQKSTEPEMSVGLPPDNEAVEISRKEQTETATDMTGVIYLNEGEKRFIKEYEMNVTFKRMVEDSRCPEGVNCIWAGVAVAEVEMMGLYTRPVTMQISTMSDAKKGYSKTQDFNGNTVSLVSVTPQTTASKGFKDLAGKYKIGLNITKGSGGDQTTQRTTTR
jgi:hypothetical protein